MKKLRLSIGLTFLSLLANTQTIDLTTPANNIKQQLESAFPLVAAAIFIVVVFFNLGHFVGQNGDWKKGAMNILIYVIVVGAVAGLYSGVTSISIG